MRSRAAIQIVAKQIDDDAPAQVSDAFDAAQYFDRLALHFRAARGAEDGLVLAVRTSADGLFWSDWRALAPDPDMTDAANNTHYALPIATPADSRFAQYRVDSGDPAGLVRVSLTAMDVSELNAPTLAKLASGLARFLVGSGGATIGATYALAAPTGAPKVLTRQDWGADESLMKWTPKYVPWQKAILHHTVTDDGGTNVAATIRSIYYYHAVSRGWGDIGYNFVVDKFGNIWTGRQGGDHVVAGHAYGWNDGTMGVASLGTYSSTPPTGQLQGAFANVVALKMKQLGIVPYGSSAFTHEEQRSDGSWIKVTTTVANVLGHRDCNYIVGATGGQTECPGNALYPMLPGLRSQAQNAWQNGYTYLARIDPALQPGGYPGQQLRVSVNVTNTGTVTIPGGTVVNYRVLKAGAVITQGAGVPLAQAIAPGAVASVVVPFGAPGIGEYVVRWDLQTGPAWWNATYGSPFRDQWFRSADWSADWLDDNVGRAWTAGETRITTVVVQNDGGRTWNASGVDPVTIGYYWIDSATGKRLDAPRQALPKDVAPGEQITLTLAVTAPQYPGSYTMVLDLYKENEFWFRDKGLAPDDTPVNVAPDFKAAYTMNGQLPTFQANQAYAVPLIVTNLGNGIFPIANANPVDLGYHWYDASGKAVVWDGARTKLPADLAPGQSVTLPASVVAPPAGGQYSLRFDLVQEGVTWFSTKGVQPGVWSVSIGGPVVAQYGALYQPGVTALAQSGAQAAVPFTVVNQSNFTWSPAGPNPVNLSYHWLDRAGQVLVWEGSRTRLSTEVAPGQSAALQAQVLFPTAQGQYTLRWDLVQEGVTWFSGKGVKPLDQLVTVGPAAFYGGSMDVSKVPSTLPARLASSVPLRVQNMSNFAWDQTVNLSYHWYDANGKVVVWDGARTALAGMAPGEVRAVNALVVGPMTAGAYALRFDIVQEGVTWFSDKGMQLAPNAVQVAVPGYGALYSAPDTANGAAGAVVQIPVTLTNVGTLVWQPGAVNLSFHLYSAAGALVAWDGQRTALPQSVGAGQTVVVNALLRLPTAAGAYVIRWDLVQEGITWLSGQGVPTAQTSLLVA